MTTPKHLLSCRLPDVIISPSSLITLLLLLLVAGNSSTSHIEVTDDAARSHFTDQWAVQIDGNETEARMLAAAHGFVYVDKVQLLVFLPSRHLGPLPFDGT